MDDELQELRKRKLRQLKQHQEETTSEQQQLQQQIAQIEAVAKQAMTKDALERYGNLKIGHPEKAVQLTVVLAQLIQQRRISKINGEQLKEILVQLTPDKKDIKITRK